MTDPQLAPDAEKRAQEFVAELDALLDEKPPDDWYWFQQRAMELSEPHWLFIDARLPKLSAARVMLQRTETLERENEVLRLAICPDGSLTDLDDLIDHAAELNLAESDMGKLLNPEQRMLEENTALRGLLEDLVGLARSAMKDANRDGCEYEIDEELKEALAAMGDA